VANALALFWNRDVGFIEWLGESVAISQNCEKFSCLMSKLEKIEGETLRSPASSAWNVLAPALKPTAAACQTKHGNPKQLRGHT
jgi:hypothetical protein